MYIIFTQRALLNNASISTFEIHLTLKEFSTTYITTKLNLAEVIFLNSFHDYEGTSIYKQRN